MRSSRRSARGTRRALPSDSPPSSRSAGARRAGREPPWRSGPGTIFLAADDGRTLSTDAATFEGQGATLLVTGLTPATVYNVALYHRVASGTGTFLRREVNVIPQLA